MEQSVHLRQSDRQRLKLLDRLVTLMRVGFFQHLVQDIDLTIALSDNSL